MSLRMRSDASAETFVEVLTQFKALVGKMPKEFVFKILRADQGSNYTSNAVKKFLNKQRTAVDYAPMQLLLDAALTDVGVDAGHSVPTSSINDCLTTALTSR
mgnify:CR=1 FL=1